jgi:hypothetical protein
MISGGTWMSGTPGRNDRATPTMTRMIGAATPSRRAKAATPTMTATAITA